jgi:serine protease Do
MIDSSRPPSSPLGRPVSGLLVVAALALSLGACGRQAALAAPPPESPVVAKAPAPAAQLPPVPVPATFDVADLAERVQPTVVNITTTHDVVFRGMGGENGDPFEFFFGRRPGGPGREMRQKQTALGTGFIIDPSGFVATNNHVVEGADGIRVRLADEREFEAEIVGRDPKLDVALLKLKGAWGLPAAELGSSDTLRVGEHVLAVGNPFGLGHTVTLGIVSAKARSIGAGPYDDFVQTDASINPGNSGGPLFNWRGQVVGINTAIRAGANGIGFAIPIDAAKDVLPQLRDKGHVERGQLGLAFQPISPELAKALALPSTHGALVTEVQPGSAAERAGLKAGDAILSVNGTSIVHAEDLRRNVARNAPGKTIALGILRGGERKELQATLDALHDDADGDARPAPRGGKPTSSHLGLELNDVPGLGVRVERVLDGSNVDDVQPGDVIVAVAGQAVPSVDALRTALAKLSPGSTALLKIRRGKSERFAAITVPAR